MTRRTLRDRAGCKALAGLALMLLALTQMHWVVSSAVFKFQGNAGTEAVSLPLNRAFQGVAEMSVRFTVPMFSGHRLRITPDERLVSLSVNGNAVDLIRNESSQLSDWGAGMQLDLSDYLHSGANELTATIENRQGDGGMSLESVQTAWPGAVPYSLLLAGTVLLFWDLAAIFRLRRSLRCIAVFSLALVILYWMQTPFATRQFDINEPGGHLDYIRYLVTQRQLPPVNGGWEYHQPPAYYLTAAAFYALGQAFPALGWQNLLRLESMLYWMVFLGAALAIIQLYLARSSVLMWMTGVAVCCWPSGFIHAIRVGNDIAFYAWYALGLWAVCEWWRTRRPQWFRWSLLFCLLAVLAKPNGLALVVTLGFLLFVRWWQDLTRSVPKYTATLGRASAWFAITLVIAVGVSFTEKIRNFVQGKSGDWLLANAGNTINGSLRVNNDWRHMAGFDWPTFVSSPWLNAWDDQTGRQYFWNYLLRSSLSSEFAFRTSLELFSTAAGILLLALLVIVLLKSLLWLMRLVSSNDLMVMRTPWRTMPLLASALSLLAFEWAFRYKWPYAMSADFRYIYPALISVMVIHGVSISRSSLWWRATVLIGPVIGLTGIGLVIFL